MFDILTIIPGKKRKNASGWHSFNAICCHNRGHREDKRMRGGVKFMSNTDWRFHCFNCSYTCSFEIGRPITNKTRQLLKWCGIDHEQIQVWNLESLKYKDFVETALANTTKPISFVEKSLPEGAELLKKDNPRHKKYVDYLLNRGFSPSSYPYMVTPSDKGRNANRIVIPFTHRNKIVGHTSRFIDNLIPKYHNDSQPGYLFGVDLQQSNWQILILVEGIFDAIAINGCALAHNEIGREQAQQISSFRKQVIFVPDQDKTGLEICEQALSLGYGVSIPNWGRDVKDVADAVKKYGMLPTLLSITQSVTSNRIKIEMRKKQILKG